MAAQNPIARELAVLSRAGYPILYLLTHEEERALALLGQAAQLGGQGLSRWTLTAGLEGQPGTQAPERAVAALAQFEQPCLFVMQDMHAHLADPAVSRALRDQLAQLVSRRQSVVVLSPVLALPPELEKDTAVLDLPLPSREELGVLFSKISTDAGHGMTPELSERAARSALGLSLNEAKRVLRRLLVAGGSLDESDLSALVEEKKRILGRSEALEFFGLSEGLSEVGGLGELKRWLADRSRAFGAEAEAFGLPTPKGLLLLGVQGCGKSLSAKAVAQLWKFPLLRLDLAALFSGGTGSPEAALREAMRVAERLAPVVLWVDEIEKGFGQAEGDETSARVFGGFITWLAEKTAQVFVVATANEVHRLPPELLRKGRFDEIFFVDLPNSTERAEILSIHLKKRGRDPAAYPELSALAKECEHFSGAELEQVVVSGLYRAFSAGRQLQQEDMSLAVQQTVPLYRTYEERIKQLRDWAKRRARPATQDDQVLSMFGLS